MKKIYRNEVCVVGSGVFGSWAALHLRRKGAEVLLLDQTGSPHPKASSGGTYRLMRAVYGDHHHYARWAAAARSQWEDLQLETQRSLFEPTGVLWLVKDDDYPGKCVKVCEEVGIDVAELDLDEARRLYPHISFDTEVNKVYLENPAGFLRAREGCEAAVEIFQREGGKQAELRVIPGEVSKGRMKFVVGQDVKVEADHFVFACGPWLPDLFPRELGGGVIEITRQVEHHFEIPPIEQLPPVCIDFGDPIFYALHDKLNHSGTSGYVLKVGEDTRGRTLDSVGDLEEPNSEDELNVRKLLAKRFPNVNASRCLYRRACTYSNTPTGDYLIDQLPGANNVWLIGGGSSHAFKMGPIVGNMAAELVAGELQEPERRFSLSRHQRDAKHGVSQTPFDSIEDTQGQ